MKKKLLFALGCVLVFMSANAKFFFYRPTTSSSSSSSSGKVFTYGDLTLEAGDALFFSVDEMPESIDGQDVLTEFAPDGIAVEWTGKKFKVPKAGKIKYSKSEEGFYSTSDENPCALKIKITKAGKVSGSFSVYVAKSETKTKAYKAKFSGKIGGELKCTIKKISGSFSAILDE